MNNSYSNMFRTGLVESTSWRLGCSWSIHSFARWTFGVARGNLLKIFVCPKAGTNLGI